MGVSKALCDALSLTQMAASAAVHTRIEAHDPSNG